MGPCKLSYHQVIKREEFELKKQAAAASKLLRREQKRSGNLVAYQKGLNLAFLKFYELKRFLFTWIFVRNHIN